MCTAAEKSALALAEAIEPTIISLLTKTNLLGTPSGQAAITAFNTVLTDLKAWVPGMSAQEAIEAITVFTDLLNVLPIPPLYKSLGDDILLGIQVVIGVLDGNQPAPAGTSQAAHAAAVEESTTAKVTAAKPEFKLSFFEKARIAAGDTKTIAGHYTHEWNADVAALGPEYADLKVS